MEHKCSILKFFLTVIWAKDEPTHENMLKIEILPNYDKKNKKINPWRKATPLDHLRVKMNSEIFIF